MRHKNIIIKKDKIYGKQIRRNPNRKEPAGRIRR